MDEPTLRSWIEETFITQHSMRRKVLQEPDQSQGMDNRVLMYLVAANLVRIEVEQQGETTWFELAHERMITPIRQSNAAWHETRLNRQRQQEKQAMLHRQALQRRWIAGLGIATALLALVAILFFLRSQHEYTRAEESTEQVTILQTTNEALLPMITAQAALTRTNIALQQTQVILEANPPVPPPSPDLSESVPLSTRPPRPAADATVQHAVSPLDVSIPSPSLPAAPTRTPTTTPLTTTLTLIATPTLTSTLERASEQAPGPR
jgi:hypothetical protein